MQTANQTSKAYMNTLRIIHIALTAGQVVFAGVAYFMSLNGPLMQSADLIRIFQIAVPALIFTGYLGGKFLPKMLLNQVKDATELHKKLSRYQTALILKLALLEGPSLIAVVAFLLTGHLTFLGLSAIVIAFFITLRPTVYKLETELELDQYEAGLMRNPEALVACSAQHVD